MKRPAPLRALVLAAGYGTRLGAVGRRTPKFLLSVAGRPLAEYLLENLADLPGLSELMIVTNSRFRRPIERWVRQAAGAAPFPLRILDDGTSRPEQRLGAVGDLAFALERMPARGDLLVLAGDTLPGFPLRILVGEWSRRPEADLLLVLEKERDPERLSSRGIARLDDAERVVGFQEKPARPPSNLTALPIYLLRDRALPRIPEYLATGGSRDAPGHLVAWLVDRMRVEGWRPPGRSRLDVGTPEGLEEARRKLSGNEPG